jgi:hypothetical protein
MHLLAEYAAQSLRLHLCPALWLHVARGPGYPHVKNPMRPQPQLVF